MPTGQVLKLKDVRIAFTEHLHVAGTFQNGPGKKKFGCKLLIGKNHLQIGDVKTEIMRLAAEEWKDKAEIVIGGLKESDYFAFHDGDFKEWDGFPGNYYINAKNATKPTYVHKDPGTKENPNLITAESGKLYSGCYVNAIISFWTWLKPKNQMNCNLLGLQFLRDGEAFTGGGTASTDEFSNEEPAGSTVVANSSFL